MDVLEAIKGRRSVRAFKKADVSAEIVNQLVGAACCAPSAGNIQPWEFVIVRKKEMKAKLVRAAFGELFVGEAPVVIVVCADENRSAQRYGDRGRNLYCLQDTAAAIQNIHLAAHSLGLGTCWVGAFDEDALGKILKVPPGMRPVAVIPVGFAAEYPSPRRKRPELQLIHQETF